MSSDARDVAALSGENAALRAEVAQLRAALARHQHTQASSDSEFLRSLLRALPAFVARVGPDLSMRFLNRYADGFSEQDTVGKTTLDFIDPAYHDVASAAIRRAFSEGSVERYTVQAQGSHGAPAYYETIVAPLREAGGEGEVVLISYDISEHVTRKQELEASQERLRLAVSATGIGLWRWDAATDVVEWNQRMHEILGVDEVLAPLVYVQRCVHPEDRAQVLAAVERVKDSERHDWPAHRIVRPDGEVRWVLPRGQASVGSDGQLLRVSGGTLDVTKTRELEARLREAEKMEALGTLTTGVAHNLNNLLAVIQPTMDMLRDYIADPGQELLDDAALATERAANVVRQLMSFAGKRRNSEAKLVELGSLVQGAVDLAKRSIPSQVEVVLHEDYPRVLVMAEQDQLSDVFYNLLLNARDAVLEVDRPRRISIAIHPRTASAEASEHSPPGADKADGYVDVVVADTGSGMDEEVQRRVFEPFFTTKAPGKGTGLGLAISWSVVRGFGGAMSCESKRGRGARFTVTLPIMEGSSGAAKRISRSALRRSGLRVLLVEDDPRVRMVTERILQRAAHETRSVGRIADALRVAKQEDFDVILLDQSLPDGKGSDFVHNLRQHSQRSRIILFTGQDVSSEELHGVDRLLQKPFRAEELLNSLGCHSNADPTGER